MCVCVRMDGGFFLSLLFWFFFVACAVCGCVIFVFASFGTAGKETAQAAMMILCLCSVAPIYLYSIRR